MASVITARDLRFAYDHEVVALSGVDLDVPPGRIGLVGANGAGKTTLLKIMLGILHPDRGSVQVLGHDVAADPLDVRFKVGYMPEGDCLPPDQTAADFVAYSAELAGLPPKAARQRSSDVLALVGLQEERFRPIGGFSTGMAQRTKLAQALVHDPELVLLDEPTAGLDPEGRDEMLDLIERLGSFGIDAVVSSHVLGDIERTCEWVIMLDGGRVLRSGPLSGLEATGTVLLEVLDDPAALIAELQRRGADVHADGWRLHVRVEGGDPFAVARDALVAAGAGLRRLIPGATTLEDVFLRAGER